jgi:hypothetical protein
VLREIRCLPEDLRRSLSLRRSTAGMRPAAGTGCTPSSGTAGPRQGLLERLTAISQHDAEQDARMTLSSAMGVTHDYRHSLARGSGLSIPFRSACRAHAGAGRQLDRSRMSHEAAVADSSLAQGASV